jgi:phosphatidylethanolamine-binding protein (PEBP) family uncharacterized protein
MHGQAVADPMKFALINILLVLAVSQAHAERFVLSSSAIGQGGTLELAHVLNSHGCNGANLSPHLLGQGAPAGIQSFVITLFDPDAPTGSGWWRWVVFNIPATAHELRTGAGDVSGPRPPAGATQSRTDLARQALEARALHRAQMHTITS